MPNLISSDSTLRLSSLQILAAVAPGTALAPDSKENTTSLREIYNLCVQIESSEMTLRNVRERTTNISRLTRSISALPVPLPKLVLKGIVTYLVAQFKVRSDRLFRIVGAFKFRPNNSRSQEADC